MIDSIITQSNECTSDKPKFLLKAVFLRNSFPKIRELIDKKDSRYYGYTLFIKRDNSGPHQDLDFMSSCVEYCEEEK